MQIYIRRDNEDFGPYSQEVVHEYVKQGVFASADSACFAGMAEWKTVGELLGINKGAKAKQGVAPRKPAYITEFNPGALPEPPPSAPPVQKRTRQPQRPKRGFIITLNVTLICILVIVGMMRVAPGRRLIRAGLFAMSGGLARLAAAPALDGEPLTAPAPAIAKASSSPAHTAATPAPAASVAPAIATAASPAPSVPAAPPPAVASASPVASPIVATAATTAAAASPVASASPASSPASQVAMNSSSDPDLDASVGPATTSAPASTPAAAPPTVAAATPAAPPAPPVAATPPPPPKPFNPADLAGNRAAWPRKVHLKQPVEFPALYNGQVVGSVTAPAGTEVALDGIQGTVLTVDYQGGQQRVDWTWTDLEQQAAKLTAPPPAAAGPPTTAMPPTTSAPPTSSAPAGASGLSAPTDTAPEPSDSN